MGLNEKSDFESQVKAMTLIFKLVNGFGELYLVYDSTIFLLGD
jgi:hypothetical protein